MAPNIADSHTYRDSLPLQVTDSFLAWLTGEQYHLRECLLNRRNHQHTDAETLHHSRYWMTEGGMKTALAQVHVGSGCHPNQAPAALLESLKNTLAERLTPNGLAFTHFAWISEALGLLRLQHPEGMKIFEASEGSGEDLTPNTRCYRLMFAIAPAVMRLPLHTKRG